MKKKGLLFLLISHRPSEFCEVCQTKSKENDGANLLFIFSLPMVDDVFFKFQEGIIYWQSTYCTRQVRSESLSFNV